MEIAWFPIMFRVQYMYLWSKGSMGLNEPSGPVHSPSGLSLRSLGQSICSCEQHCWEAIQSTYDSNLSLLTDGLFKL